MTTIQDLFHKGSSLLKDLPNPYLDTKLLLLECCSVSKEKFLSAPEKKVTKVQERCFYKRLSKRLEGVPIAYLTGIKEFWSIPFKVSSGVLIPRPETELIVEKVLDLSSGQESLIVDIGTGCGNIAVSLAAELPQVKIVATDISKKALKIAQLNASKQKIANITFISGSLYFPLKKIELKKKCDFIVSNPPYVSEKEWLQLSKEIKNNEPKNSLVAGKRGTEVIHELIQGASVFLKSGGSLILEIGEGQKEEINSFFDSKWIEIKFFSDLNGVERVVSARR